MTISPITQQDISSGGSWGGPRKQRYYTPDGSEVHAIPATREYVIRDEAGKVIRQGERDANLDKGWSFSPPTVLQVYCPGCGKYHDDAKKVSGCVTKSAKAAKQWEAKAKKQYEAQHGKPVETNNTAALSAQVEALTALVAQLLEEKNG